MSSDKPADHNDHNDHWPVRPDSAQYTTTNDTTYTAAAAQQHPIFNNSVITTNK